jgi:hypothetical protein
MLPMRWGALVTTFASGIEGRGFESLKMNICYNTRLYYTKSKFLLEIAFHGFEPTTFKSAVMTIRQHGLVLEDFQTLWKVTKGFRSRLGD